MKSSTTTITTTRTKIYCKDCKYFKDLDFCTYLKNSHAFDKITGIEREISPYQEMMIFSEDGKKLLPKHRVYNANNDCKYFEEIPNKKWWRFWK